MYFRAVPPASGGVAESALRAIFSERKRVFFSGTTLYPGARRNQIRRRHTTHTLSSSRRRLPARPLAAPCPY